MNKQLGFENLTVSYHRHPAIHHLNAMFNLGTTTAIIGPNGGGKSTLLKTLIGEVKAETGRVIKSGVSAKDIAYLPQFTQIDDSLPMQVEDAVLLGLWYQMGLFGGIKSEVKAQVSSALKLVGLSGFEKRYLSELSRGQLQRVLFARIVMQDAPIVLLDEPFNAVDSKTIEDLLGLINKWHNQGKTVIAVLHDLTQVVNTFEYSLLVAKNLIAYDKTQLVLTNSNLQRAYASNLGWMGNNMNACEI